MTLAEQLRASRFKHTLKNYEDAMKQLRVFKAVVPITSKRIASQATGQRDFGSSSKEHLKH